MDRATGPRPKRRRLLALCASLAAGAGCVGGAPGTSPSPTRSPGDPPSTATERPSPSATPSASGTRTDPFEFATVHSTHDATHRVRVVVTDVASGTAEYELERRLEPGFENRIEVTDEWLTEAGTYRVEAKTDDGLSTAIEVEADATWACDHSVAVEVTREGRLVSAVAAGSGKGC